MAVFTIIPGPRSKNTHTAPGRLLQTFVFCEYEGIGIRT